MQRNPLPDTRRSITKRFELVMPVAIEECLPEIEALRALAADAIQAINRSSVDSPDASSLAERLHAIDIAPRRMRSIKLYFTVDMYDDGSPGGVFVKADKAGSFAAGAIDAVALEMSIALQHGVPLYILLEKIRATKFEPSGRTMDADVPSCTSVLDLLARWLEKKFPTHARPAAAFELPEVAA